MTHTCIGKISAVNMSFYMSYLICVTVKIASCKSIDDFFQFQFEINYVYLDCTLYDAKGVALRDLNHNKQSNSSRSASS